MATDNTQQYSFKVFENYNLITEGTIDDPFANTTLRPKGLKNALRVLFGRYQLQVCINGTRAAYGVVFGGDYTEAPDSGERIVMGGCSEKSA